MVRKTTGAHEKSQLTPNIVSEDFDCSLRLQIEGYVIRYVTYFGSGFKEGVSLTVYDELARWEKYAYGCDELVFNPLKLWLFKGPFTPLFRKFMGSKMRVQGKIGVLSYIGTYVSASLPIHLPPNHDHPTPTNTDTSHSTH